MKRSHLIFAFVSLTLICGTFKVNAQQSDFVFQPGIMLEKKISRSIALRLYTQAFQNQNAGENASVFSELTLQYKINNRISITTGFRNGLYRSRSNDYDDRQLFSFAANYSKSRKNWTISLRSRFQRLYFGDFGSDNYRDPRNYLRYRISIKRKINYYFSPYLEYEAFQPLNIPKRQGLDQHRLSAGLNYTLNENLKFEAYYQIMKLTARTNNKTNYILGLNTLIRL